jgi:hypothetical protein
MCVLDVLSQAEIDRLLKDLAAGSGEENDADSKNIVKTYDFKTANRFTKDQIRRSSCFNNFGHLLSNYPWHAEPLRLRGAVHQESVQRIQQLRAIARYSRIINTEPLLAPSVLRCEEIAYSFTAVAGGTKESRRGGSLRR